MSDEEIEGKGFVIKDRRRFTDEGELKEEAPAEEKDERPESGTEEEEKAEPEAAVAVEQVVLSPRLPTVLRWRDRFNCCGGSVTVSYSRMVSAEALSTSITPTRHR